MRQLRRALRAQSDSAHPVWSQLPRFADHLAAVTELRMQRLGLLDRPLAQVPSLERRRWIAQGLAARAWALVPKPHRKLTDTYLDDPMLRAPVDERFASARAESASHAG